MKVRPIRSSLRLLPCLAAFLAWPAVAGAQAQESSFATGAQAFLAEHDGAWRVVAEPTTGRPAFVYGDRFALPVAPRNDAAFAAAARQVVDQNAELFGIPSATLRLKQVKHLDLSRIGSADKVAVTFAQVVDQVPVHGGTVTILFDAASGDVLALDTTGIPGAHEISLVPGSSTSEALAAAEAAYDAHFGVAAAEIGATVVAIIGPNAFFGAKNPLTDRGATLAYVFELSTPGLFTADEQVPVQARVFVSAEGDLTVFKVEPTAHAIDGNVAGNVNVGQQPNTSTNQETPPLQNLWVRQGAANGTILATTDANGNYNVVPPGPLSLFFELRGPFCDVDEDGPGGVDSSFVLAGATGSGNNVLFNPGKTEFPTAEVAGFFWVNEFREWVVAVDPTDNTMDFSVFTEVNRDDLTCNAYYDGNSINLMRAAGGCTNTAYSDVTLHEEGHWANEVYQSGGVTGAFHEGNADVFAYYINDDPCLESFGGGGGCLRNALQTSVKKCGIDGDESCNGGASHLEGQALASACWAVRANLNTALGNAAGDAVANVLFSAWMNTFNDTALLNVIQDHWVALDDDNGTLTDGTPHFAQITNGFQAYNWPSLPDVQIIATARPATNAEVHHLQPVQVAVTAISALGAITGVVLHYAPDGAGFSTAAMLPTGNPNEFGGLIPGFPSPNRVRWYVTATSTAGGNETFPAAAPASPELYHVGDMVTLASFAFDGIGDDGWTHVLLGGSNGDQWERANPASSNEATDPSQAFSPARVWGTDLSASGFDGKYEPNGSGELRSPTFNLAGTSKVFLQYRRWLAVEEAAFDQAQIWVANALVWQNATNGHHVDTSWALHDLDVTAQAAGNPAVQVRYRLTSDGGLEFGGWNLDDFVLYRVDATPGGFFQTYGSGCPGTGGVTPSLTGTGAPVGLGTVDITVTGGQPGAAGLVLIGLTQTSVDIGAGCTLLVGNLVGGGLPVTLNGLGSINLQGQLPANLPSLDAFFQFYGADAGAGNGQFSASNGLRMHTP